MPEASVLPAETDMKKGELNRTLLFLLFLLSGIILGTILTNVAQNVPFLNWLCWGDSIGIDTVTIDLAVLRLNFGFTLEANIAKLLCIITSILIYAGVARKV